jgi:hypothetical protein
MVNDEHEQDTMGNPTSYIVRGQDIRPVPDPTALTQKASDELEKMMRNLITTEIEHQRELFDEKLDGNAREFTAQVAAIQERSVGHVNQYNERLEGVAHQFLEKIENASARFDALDARTAEQKTDTKVALDGIVTGLTDLYDEKMATITEKLIGNINQFNKDIEKIYARFDMLDARTAEQKSDTKAALDAALAAQKEAVSAQTASSEKAIIKSETATIERIKAVETLLSANNIASDGKISDIKERIGKIEALKTGAHESGIDMRAILTSVLGVVIVLIAMASLAIALLKP